MVVAKSRRSNAAIKVETTEIDQVGALLADLPEREKTEVPLRDAIEELQDSLRASLGKGYSYEELTKILNDSGIAISASTLKRYLSIVQKKPATVGKTRAKRVSKDRGSARL
jgi:predicted AAA+ superfamily ATPase